LKTIISFAGKIILQAAFVHKFRLFVEIGFAKEKFSGKSAKQKSPQRSNADLGVSGGRFELCGGNLLEVSAQCDQIGRNSTSWAKLFLALGAFFLAPNAS
jgi:hypothetical protein